MKITNRVTELLFDLSEIELIEESSYFTSDVSKLHDNLLRLYTATDNYLTKETIIEIISEAGKPCLSRLIKPSRQVVRKILRKPSVVVANEDQFMTNEAFLDLLPANAYFH